MTEICVILITMMCHFQLSGDSTVLLPFLRPEDQTKTSQWDVDHGCNQTPCQYKPTDDPAQDDHGQTLRYEVGHGATGGNPEEHPMDAKGQATKDPEP